MYLDALALVLEPINLLFLVCGVIVGFLVGVLPGLSTSNTAALLLPFSVTLPTEQALILIVSIYAGAAFGGSVLQTADVYLTLPGLGELHLVSSIGFDIGVYLVVVGLVLDLLRAFGAGLDRMILASREASSPEVSETPSPEGGRS